MTGTAAALTACFISHCNQSTPSSTNKQPSLSVATTLLFTMQSWKSVFLWTFAIGWIAAKAAETGETETTTTTTTATAEASTCGLYVAPSSTQREGDHAATLWGLYAGKEITVGDTIGYPELAIPLWNLKANAVNLKDDSQDANLAEAFQAMLDFLEAYIWVPGPVGARFAQKDGNRLVAAIPGAGVLSAFDVKLTNANWKHHAAYQLAKQDGTDAPSTTYYSAGISHPGRGAVSSFYSATVEATADIAKGSEIFMDYGENWADEERREALVLEDYKKLDKTIEKMIAFFEKHHELHDASKAQIYNFLTKDVMIAAVGHFKAKTIAKLLPSSPDELPEIPKKGGILVHSAPTVYRQDEWLQTNGFCVDHLKPGQSTVPHAGRGAFASRSLPAGTVVTASPLIHIPDKRLLELHPLVIDPEAEEEGEREYMRSEDTVTGHQLLLNYCYGHPDSSMLFFPAGPMAALINHAPTKDQVNVKLQWSTHPQHKTAWYDVDPYDLVWNADHHHLGLVMEVVATRDIQPGEEIFLDYGAEYQEAWDQHAAAWKAGVDGRKEWPLRAADYMAKHSTQPLETAVELGHDPSYPNHVQLKAFLMIEESLRAGSREDPKFWAMPETGTAYDSDNLFDLVVEDRRQIEDEHGNKTFEYLVRWTNNRGVDTFVDHVPSDALVFVDAPGEADEFSVDKPFRHYIGIPDSIFPHGAWRNLK